LAASSTFFGTIISQLVRRMPPRHYTGPATAF
jgi:hypothetical protein